MQTLHIYHPLHLTRSFLFVAALPVSFMFSHSYKLVVRTQKIYPSGVMLVWGPISSVYGRLIYRVFSGSAPHHGCERIEAFETFKVEKSIPGSDGHWPFSDSLTLIGWLQRTDTLGV